MMPQGRRHRGANSSTLQTWRACLAGCGWQRTRWSGWTILRLVRVARMHMYVIHLVVSTALVATSGTAPTIAQLTPVLNSFAYFNHTPVALLEKLPHTNGAPAQCCTNEHHHFSTTSAPPQHHLNTSLATSLLPQMARCELQTLRRCFG